MLHFLCSNSNSTFFSYFFRDQPEILRPPSNPFDGENINIYEQIRPRGELQEAKNMQRPEIGQVIDVNLSPWTEFYPTGIDVVQPVKY